MRHRGGRNRLVFAVGGAVALGATLPMLVADLDLLRRRVAQLASAPPQLQSPKPSQPRAVAIKSLPVRRGDLEQRIGLTGDIEAEASVQVFSKVAGVLEELAVETGDYVHAGQLLGRIEWRELAARVDQAAALR